MAVGCVSALAAAANALLLPETLHRAHNQQGEQGGEASDEDAPMLGARTEDAWQDSPSSPFDVTAAGDAGGDAGHVQLSTLKLSTLKVLPQEALDDEGCKTMPPVTPGNDDKDDVATQEARLPRLLSRRNLSTQGLYTVHRRHAPGTADAGPWHRQRSVRFALASYVLVAFLHRLSDELVPLFAAAPVSTGGLGWTAAALAPSLSFGGAVLMGFALVGYPSLQRRLGVKACARVGLLATVPSGFLFPAAALFRAHAAQQAMFFLAAGARAMVGIMAFTSTIVAVNLCAPKHEMGVVNGVGQSLAAGMRAAAPAGAGLLWSAVMSMDVEVHVRGLIAFSVVGGVAILARIVCGQVELPETGDKH